MISLNFGPDLEELSRDEMPDPDDCSYDDLTDAFERLLEDEDADTFSSGELDFNER